MKLLATVLFVLFAQKSLAVEINHYSERSVGAGQITLITTRMSFPNGNIATVEEKIVDGQIVVNLTLQKESQLVLFDNHISKAPIVMIPGSEVVPHYRKEKELYKALDSDNFVVFSTEEGLLVVRQDGVHFFSKLEDGFKNVRTLRVGRDLTRVKYTVGSEEKSLAIEPIFKDSEAGLDKNQARKVETVKDNSSVEINLQSEKAKIVLKGAKGADLVLGNKTIAITKNQVKQYSVRDEKTELEDIEMLNQQDKTAVLITNKEVLLVSHTGLVRSVEVDRKKLKKEDVKIDKKTLSYLMPVFGTVDSDGKTFAVLSFEYERDSANGPTLGETYVWDIETDDLVRVAYRPTGFSKNTLKVDNGILTIVGIDRKIDLRALKAENAFFKAGLPPKVKDESGGQVDAVKEVDSGFVNMGEEVRSGRRTVFAIDAESQSVLDNLTAVMAQKESPNPMLVAEAGAGKSELVYAFIKRIMNGEVSGIPRTVYVIDLSVGGLSQGTKYSGSIEKRLKALEGAATQVPMIAFADEIHTLRGVGTHEGNPDNDALAMLKPALISGVLHMLGTSTEDEFNNAFGGDAALMRRFSIVRKDNPTREQVLRALDSWTERFGYPKLSPEVKEYLIDVSNRFVVYGVQPSKATSVMDKAYARKVSLKLSKEALTIEDINEALIASGVDKKLFEVKTATQILDNLKKEWSEKMAGQEAALDSYYLLESMRLAGLLDPEKPASVLVTGPRGAGKTRGAMAYAAATGRKSVKFNMADYAEGGVKEFQKRLSQEIFKDRFAVFVFDEIEKASLEVKNVFLAIMQDGKIKIPAKLSASASVANSTETLDFTQATIVGTTNAGQDYVVKVLQAGVATPMGFSKQQEQKQDVTSKIQHAVNMEDGLKKAIINDGLSTFLVDRFTVIVPAFTSKQDQFREVIRINLVQMLSGFTKNKGIEFEVKNLEVFLDFATAAYYRENASNRIVENILNTHFRKQIALALGPVDTKNIKKALIEFDPQSGESKVTPLGACGAALL